MSWVPDLFSGECLAWSSKAQGTGEFAAKLKRKKPVTRELKARSKGRCFDFDLRLVVHRP